MLRICTTPQNVRSHPRRRKVQYIDMRNIQLRKKIIRRRRSISFELSSIRRRKWVTGTSQPSTTIHPLTRAHTPPNRGFKALKQSTKLLFLTLRRPADALKTYIRLLTYTKSAVTRNYSEKTINGILDYVGGGKSGPIEVDVLERFYQATKDALIEAKNEVRG